MNRLDDFRKQAPGCALVDSRVNMQYLTGYTGEGSLLILPEKAVILTDSRYTEQAERQSPFCIVERTSMDAKREDLVKKYLAEAGVNELYVETGLLTVKAFRRLESALTGVALKDLPDVCLDLRTVKTEEELECMRKAIKISCAAFMDLLDILHAGMTEKQARMELDYLMLKHGSEGNAFNTIVASGANGSLPHAVPSDKVIETGDLVTFDFGARWGGYCSDCTRTVAIGNVSDELKAIYEAVYNAHMLSLKEVKPGVKCSYLDTIARDYLEAIYPGGFGHSLGHGVGIEIHEMPGVNRRSEYVLKKGHVITIEPGIYIPGVGGCRIEDTAFVTEDGYEDLYTIPKQLITL